MYQQMGGCCQDESDPATCFLGDLADVSKCDQEDVDLALKSLMCWDVLPELGYVTKQTVTPSDN